MKKYSSFREIDQQLQIFSLQREIDKESLKLNLNRVKVDLYPSNLMGGFKDVLQKSLLTLVITKLLKRNG
jgi:hypothetical protein